MTDSSERTECDTGLSRDLLSMKFEIQTNWHVITGAPCSGKTTIIQGIAAGGFRILPETGRMYVEDQIAAGRTLEEIRADGILFDRVIQDLQFQRECNLQPNDVVFLDRGLPDSLAFYRLAGLDPNEILPHCFHHRYAGVFVLDRFPTRKDAARIEDEAAAEFLDYWTAAYYGALGYQVVRVPIAAPDERCSFVLKRVRPLRDAPPIGPQIRT
jgi:predicted ATPase